MITSAFAKSKATVTGRLNLPNLISGLRLGAAPILVVLAWSGHERIFLGLLVASLLSDNLDGLLARKLNQVTELGAKLDSWADFATFIVMPFCAWSLWPDMVRRETPWAIAGFASYLPPILFGFWKYGRLISYHSWGGKTSHAAMCFSLLTLFIGGPAWPFHLAIGMVVMTSFEEMAITAVLPEWRANVPSLWRALKIRRELAAAAVNSMDSLPGSHSSRREPAHSLAASRYDRSRLTSAAATATHNKIG